MPCSNKLIEYIVILQDDVMDKIFKLYAREGKVWIISKLLP
jgi:hypothetical protein